MIESALVQNPQTNDPAYQSWNKTVRQTTARLSYHNDRTAGPIPAFGTMVKSNIPLTQSYSAHAVTTPNSTEITYEPTDNSDGFSFFDVLDIVNPLQHLPVIGTLYRKFTGDQIGHVASIIGGALFGGPVGAASSVANVMVKESTGRDVGDNMLALVGLAPDMPDAKPDLEYNSSKVAISFQETPRTTLANANNTYNTVKNFAATKPIEQRWNS